MPFLDYITAYETKWMVCIGVPNGTHVWQVGDSSEQKSAFEMAPMTAKQIILDKKNEDEIEKGKY